MAIRSQEMRPAPRSNNAPMRPYVAVPPISIHAVAYAATVLLALLAIYAIMGNVVGWGRDRLDDMRYGTPRTYHVEAIVGPGDNAAAPSRFIAMNLNRQVVVYQIPAGDTAQTRVITGPYLFGAGEDKTPVLLSFRDLNNDGALDMIVNVKSEAIVYLNRDGQFQALSPEERLQLAATGS
ncbi:MAG TPA: hypothetical protein PKA05_11055 [Roseiflexaceae bacterium]|nr:hypothetical protein [Roseiflexaceae bacterium]HMP40910.1 hypothetical protein [Roseiflexaceae bacterium]